LGNSSITASRSIRDCRCSRLGCLAASTPLRGRPGASSAIEERGWWYILGARPRASREVREEVLSGGGATSTMTVVRAHDPEPLELEIKEVMLGEDGERWRYVLCRNLGQARRGESGDHGCRPGGKLKAGARGLVGNRGYRRYLRAEDRGFRTDAQRVRAEEKYDSVWVLRTNTILPMREVALRYKELWQVEQAFRTAKSLLDTRPIFHKSDETIRGHVFCSFLALLLQKELFLRMAKAGIRAEWKGTSTPSPRLRRRAIADHHTPCRPGARRPQRLPRHGLTVRIAPDARRQCSAAPNPPTG